MNSCLVIDIFHYKDSIHDLLHTLDCDPSLFRGLILILPSNIIDLFFQKNRGLERLNFLNSKSLRDSIVYFTKLSIDTNRKLIVFPENNYIDLITHSLLNSFPENYMISVISTIDKINTFKKLNFTGITIVCNSNNIIFSKYNKISNSNMLNEKYNFYNNQQSNCKINLTVKNLDKVYHKGIFSDKLNQIHQVEIFGKLRISSIEDSKITIEPDESSFITGQSDNVAVSYSMYSFHTHHYSLYDEYNTNLGYPSASDYFGVFVMYKMYNSIVHFVVANEGVYSICISPSVFDKELDIEEVKKLITAKFNIDKTHMIAYDIYDTVNKYIEYINNIKINGTTLFIIDFFKDKSSFDMEITFKKTDCNCIIDDTDRSII